MTPWLGVFFIKGIDSKSAGRFVFFEGDSKGAVSPLAYVLFGRKGIVSYTLIFKMGAVRYYELFRGKHEEVENAHAQGHADPLPERARECDQS
jgi:hypothetical protein